MLTLDFPQRLKAARRAAGLTQADVAKELGVHVMSVSGWERGLTVPEEPRLARLAELFGTDPASLRYGAAVTPADHPGTVPQLALRRRLPTRAYDVVLGHIHAMEAAGCSQAQIDEAERVMVDGAYNKLNKRDFRERSDDDIVTDIEAAWEFISFVLRKAGAPL